MSKKWKYASELCSLLNKDSTMMSYGEKIPLKFVTYAANIGYIMWIFKYKGIFVALADIGNGHYEFYSVVSRIDVIIAKMQEVFRRYL